MNTKDERNSTIESPQKLTGLLPLIASITGLAILIYSVSRYNDLLNQSESFWYHWFQTALVALIGIVCLISAFISVLSKQRMGWQLFIVGLSLFPIILFINLLVFLFDVIQGVLAGETLPLISRLYESNPAKIILGIVAALILLSVVKKVIDKNTPNSDDH